MGTKDMGSHIVQSDGRDKGKNTKTIFGRSSFITWFLAVLYAAFSLIGYSFSKGGSLRFVTEAPVRSLFLFLLLTVLFNLGITFIYDQALKAQYSGRKEKKKILPEVLDRHFLPFSAAMIFLCWLPYLIVFYPGSIPFDGYYQIDMGTGVLGLADNHPVYLSFFYGFLVNIGRRINDNFGAFLVVLVCAVIAAFCYGALLRFLRRHKAPVWLQIGTFLLFTVMPLFGAYAQAIVKDTIYCPLFTLFLVNYAECCMNEKKGQDNKALIRDLVKCAVLGILVCLTRRNGFILVAALTLVLIFYVNRGRRWYVLVMLLVISAVFLGSGQFASKVLKVRSSGARVILSIPFQQTARYLKEYPDDVTEEEKAAIDGVLNYPVLAGKYNPEVSDPVKNTYKKTGNAALKRYLKAWLSMGMRHPLVYFESFFHNSYGYYYPLGRYDVLGPFQFYISNKSVDTGEFDFHYIYPAAVRKKLISYAQAWRDIPVLKLFVNPGIYTWILLLSLGFLIYRRKWRDSLFLLCLLLQVAICIASPANGQIRYAMPLVAVTPLILYWGFFKERDE